MWWRPLAWFAAFCWLLALVPVAEQAFGTMAGCAVLLLAVALGFWRVERWCARALLVGLSRATTTLSPVGRLSSPPVVSSRRSSRSDDATTNGGQR